MGQQFLGEIRLFPFGFAPKGWVRCEGQLLPINQNQALFALLGTMYGGDGRVTFALPNLQGRTPMHRSQSYPQGATLGQATTTLTTNQMPVHNHAMMAGNVSANSGATTGNALASPQADQIYGAAAQATNLANAVAPTGQAQPYDNHQPYLVLSYCIAMVGIFPSHN